MSIRQVERAYDLESLDGVVTVRIGISATNPAVGLIGLDGKIVEADIDDLTILLDQLRSDLRSLGGLVQ